MRMRLGFLTGFAAGYVLGAKAGRERYDQIAGLAQKAMGTEPAQQLQDEVRVVAERVGEKTAEGMHKVSEKVLTHDHSGSGGNGAQDINLTNQPDTGNPPGSPN